MRDLSITPSLIHQVQKSFPSKTVFLTMFLFHLGLEKYVKQNPLLGFIPLSTEDLTYVQRYQNGSYYHTHCDRSVLTAVHLIYVQDFKGGQLHFPEHNYTPPLKHNKCIIFSGYENHGVKEIKSDHKGYIRYSINQRLYLAKE